MRTVSAPPLAPTEINRKELRPGARSCVGAFGRACIGIWGKGDAAIELAARSGYGLRVAEYKIAGSVKPNGIDIAVIVDEITREFR